MKKITKQIPYNFNEQYHGTIRIELDNPDDVGADIFDAAVQAIAERIASWDEVMKGGN